MLVVEVTSRATRRRDVALKREAYARWGIPEYWIVDRDARTVTVVRPHTDEIVARDTLRWEPHPAVPALEIDVQRIFGPQSDD